MPDSLPWDKFTNNNPVSVNSNDPVLVIGAGLAGCWMARTLAERNIRVTVLEAGSMPACGASSNPAGIVKPFVTRSPSLAMNFYVQAHRYLLDLLSKWNLAEACSYSACGVVQLVESQYPESAHYRCLLPQEVTQILGSPSDAHGLLFEKSGWLNPYALCNTLLEHPLIDVHCDRKVADVKRVNQDRWEIIDCHHSSWITAHLVISTGSDMPQLPISKHLTITPARGQISRFAVANTSAITSHVISGKQYLIPDGRTVIIGATFERGVCDDSVQPQDNHANIAGLASIFPAIRQDSIFIQAYAGVRATTPDRLPLVGPIHNDQACSEVYADLRHGRNLYNYPVLPVHTGAHVLGGLGSRGIVTAPFAARLLADHLMGGNEITQWAPLVNPARFQIRELKRGTAVRS